MTDECETDGPRADESIMIRCDRLFSWTMMVSSGSKRPAGVLLGTDWGVPQQQQGNYNHTLCDCVVCKPRKPEPKEKIQEKIRSGYGRHYCKAFCGGSRVAGDGKYTTCKQHGKLTVCSGCYRMIEPTWFIDKSKRQRLLTEERYSLEQLIALNKELQEMAAALE